jgi:hypothetical protein
MFFLYAKATLLIAATSWGREPGGYEPRVLDVQSLTTPNAGRVRMMAMMISSNVRRVGIVVEPFL